MAKVLKTGILQREYLFERGVINEAARTVELAFSSELPVLRFLPEFGRFLEVLDHSPESVLMDEMRDGAPLLLGHSPDDQIGVVESATLSKDRKARATVRFSKSQRGSEMLQDVIDGIRRKISVGYRVESYVPDERSKTDPPTLIAKRWSPMEISLVAIPADRTVGVGRNVDERQFETRVEESTQTNNMPNETTKPDSVIIQPVTPRAEVSAPSITQMPDSMCKESIQIFRATAAQHGDKVPGLRELAIKAEVEDWTVARFRAAAGAIVPHPEPISGNKPLEIPKRDLEWYSLSRAVNALLSNQPIGGIERELSDEITKRNGRSPQGFWIPPHVMVHNMMRTVQTVASGAVGAFVVETQNLAEQFIELLRNKAQVMALGARTLNLTEPVTIPRQSSAGTANWVTEIATSTPTTLGLTQITLSPKCVTGHMQYGKQLLITSNPSIDNLVRDDITNVIALAIDQVCLHGGGSGEPSGIVATTGIGSIDTTTNGIAVGTWGTTFYAGALSLETLVSTANADMGALAYLGRSSLRGAMKAAARFTNTDSPIWTSGFNTPGQIPSNASNDGIVNGYRAAVSNQIKTNLTVGTATTICSALFFGNWNEMLIGQFNGGAIDLVVDPYTLATARIVRLIASYWCDVGLRHPASFAILNGII